MKKCYEVRRNDYIVITKIVKNKKMPKELKKLAKIAIKVVQDYTGFKKKYEIIYTNQESEVYGEFFGIIKKRGRIVVYLKRIEAEENSDEHFIRTIMHEYLHLYFTQKKLNRIFDLETEEELIDAIEEDLWQKYFI